MVFELLAVAVAGEPDLDALARLAEARLRSPPGCWAMHGTLDWRWSAGVFGGDRGTTRLAGTLADGAWGSLADDDGGMDTTPLWGRSGKSSPGALFLLDALDHGSSIEDAAATPTGLRWTRRLDSGTARRPNELVVDFVGEPPVPVRWALAIRTPTALRDEGDDDIRVSRLTLVLDARPDGAPLRARFEGRFVKSFLAVTMEEEENWSATGC